MSVTYRRIKQWFIDAATLAEDDRLEQQINELLDRRSEFDAAALRLDNRCVEIATELLPLERAHSPRAAPLKEKLRLAEAERAVAAGAFAGEMGPLRERRRQSNDPVVKAFREECNARIALLDKERLRNPTGKEYTRDVAPASSAYVRDVTFVEIETNSEAISKAREKIEAAGQNISKFQSRSLRELVEEIERLRAEFDGIDLGETRKVEISRGQLLSERSDRRPDLVDGAAVADLSARIGRLERRA